MITAQNAILISGPDKAQSESQQTSLPRKPLPPPTAKKPAKNKTIDKHKGNKIYNFILFLNSKTKIRGVISLT